MQDKTSYFIPSGYDRFSLLKSNDKQHDIDEDYFEMIKAEEKMKEIDEIMEEEEIICEKVSDYLKKIKERIYRSRGSIIKENIKFGQKKKETEEKTNKLEYYASEIINKFDVFLKNKEIEPEKPNLSKEERTKKTRDTIMHKLNIKKSKNTQNNK